MAGERFFFFVCRFINKKIGLLPIVHPRDRSLGGKRTGGKPDAGKGAREAAELANHAKGRFSWPRAPPLA